jgi:hypothetical protein
MTRSTKLVLAAAGLSLLIGSIWWHNQPGETPGSSTGSKYSQLSEAAQKASGPETIAELRTTLDPLPKAEAVAWILRMLDSGRDAVTGQPFRIGSGGSLTEAPTLRVWLLDRLGQLDPTSAAKYSQRIYERLGSADEWAIALRNDWRVAVQTGGMASVRNRVLELLDNPGWAADPSIGFLEAFDVAVATLSWEAVPRFERWLTSGESRPLQKAAWLALDRLAIESPTDFTTQLNLNPGWLATQPSIRAGLMARANIAIETDRLAMEAYLRRGDLSEVEGQRFFELYPNVSGSVSQNLVTIARLVSLSEVAHRDQRALQGVRDWLERADFSRWHSNLKQAEARLIEACASAARGGILTP